MMVVMMRMRTRVGMRMGIVIVITVITSGILFILLAEVLYKRHYPSPRAAVNAEEGRLAQCTILTGVVFLL